MPPDDAISISFGVPGEMAAYVPSGSLLVFANGKAIGVLAPVRGGEPDRTRWYLWCQYGQRPLAEPIPPTFESPEAAGAWISAALT